MFNSNNIVIKEIASHELDKAFYLMWQVFQEFVAEELQKLN